MKKIVSLLLLITLLVLPLSAMTACSTDSPDNIRVYVLNGTTGFGMAKMINDYKDDPLYSFTVQTDPSIVSAALISGDVDIAALPTNAASNVYNKTRGGVKVIAVNTLGCLYLLTKGGTTVNNFADLKGKTVYVPAQNPTFIFTDLCRKNGLIPGTDVTISNEFAEPAALRAQIVAGKIDVAVLPEPMVTMAISGAKQNNVTITNAMDLTVEWDKVNTPGSLVQGCVVVRTEFLEKYPEAVSDFLEEYEKSIAYLTESTAEAAQMIYDNGIFANAAVAEKAIPKCNVCFLVGDEMKEAMNTYLTVLMGINANAIGSTLPSNDFYFDYQGK